MASPAKNLLENSLISLRSGSDDLHCTLPVWKLIRHEKQNYRSFLIFATVRFEIDCFSFSTP